MKGWKIFNFACAVLIISIGCSQLLEGYAGAGACFGWAAVIYYLPGQVNTRSISGSRLWPTFGLLFAISVAVAVCDFYRSASACVAIRRVICHPVFVALLWLFLMWGLFRRWQKYKGVADV